MSCKTTVAYVKLLQAVKDLITSFAANGSIPLEEFSLDFETAMWKAFSRVFPDQYSWMLFPFLSGYFSKNPETWTIQLLS